MCGRPLSNRISGLGRVNQISPNYKRWRTQVQILQTFSSPIATNLFDDTRHIWNRILFESENFCAVPSLGALVEGWLLVVPKKEAICIGALETSLFSELHSFVGLVASRLQTVYGPVALFEHGPHVKDTAVGCGVDHAHLHLVPTRYSLLSGARELAPALRWRDAFGLPDTRAQFTHHRSYLFLEQPYGGTSFLTNGPCIPSQLFRRVVSKCLGTSEKYDWKRFSQLQNISATIAALAQ